MKPYVGTAKNVPGLADAAQVHRRQHQDDHRSRRPSPRARRSAGIADAAYWTPDEIDTATVST